MKKLNSIVTALAVILATGAAVFATGCKHNDYDNESTHQHRYTCKMHPEVVQDSAGNCPKCGMRLVHKD